MKANLHQTENTVELCSLVPICFLFFPPHKVTFVSHSWGAVHVILMYFRWTEPHAQAQTTCILHLFCSLPLCTVHSLLPLMSVNPEYAGKHTVKHSQCCLCDNLEAHFSVNNIPEFGFPGYILSISCKKACVRRVSVLKGLRKKWVQNVREVLCLLCDGAPPWLTISVGSKHFVSVGC